MRVGIQPGLGNVEQIADYCRQADVDEIVLSASAIPDFIDSVSSDSISSSNQHICRPAAWGELKAGH